MGLEIHVEVKREQVTNSSCMFPAFASLLQRGVEISFVIR